MNTRLNIKIESNKELENENIKQFQPEIRSAIYESIARYILSPLSSCCMWRARSSRVAASEQNQQSDESTLLMK